MKGENKDIPTCTRQVNERGDDSFEYCVRNPQKHGSYMPFARVLGLSGATQNEPSLSAIALGVSSVYQSAVCWLG